MFGGTTTVNTIEARVESSGFDALNSQIGSTVGRLKSLRVAVGATSAAIAGLGAAISGKAVQAAADYESALAELQKVTDAQTVGVMNEELLRMSETIPLTAVELADLATQAGQFGIRGSENIQNFTSTVARMSTAAQLSTTEAGESLAKLSQLTGTPIPQVENLGAAINTMSNIAATSAQEVIDSMLRASATLSQMGMSQVEITALSASLNEVSESSERAGTRLRRLGQEITAASGTKLETMATGLGITTDEFVAMRQNAPLELMRRMATTMDQGGDSAQTLGSALSTVSRQALAALGMNLDGLQTNLDAANTSFREGTSLQEEFEVQSATLNNQLQLTRNIVQGMAISIGQQLLPSVTSVVEGLNSALRATSEWTRSLNQATVQNGLLAVQIGGVLGALTALNPALGAATAAVVGMAQAYRTNFIGIRDSTNLVIAAVRDDLVPAFQRTGSVIGGILREMGAAFTRYSGVAENAARALVRTLGTEVAGGVRSMASSINATLDATEQAWARYGATVIDDLEAIGGTLSYFVANVLNLFRAAIERDLGLAISVFGEFEDSITQVMMAVSVAMRDLMNVALGGMLGDVRTTTQQITSTFQSNGQTAARSYQMAFSGLRASLGAIMSGMVALIGGDLDRATALFSAAGIEIRASFVAAIRGLSTSVQTVLSRLSGIWTQHGADVQRTVTTFVTAAIGAYRTRIAQAAAQMRTSLGQLADLWRRHGDQVAQIAGAVIGAAAAAYTSHVQRLVTAVTNGLTRMSDAYQSHSGVVERTTSRVRDALSRYSDELTILVPLLGGLAIAAAKVGAPFGAMATAVSGASGVLRTLGAVAIPAVLGSLTTMGSSVGAAAAALIGRQGLTGAATAARASLVGNSGLAAGLSRVVGLLGGPVTASIVAFAAAYATNFAGVRTQTNRVLGVIRDEFGPVIQRIGGIVKRMASVALSAFRSFGSGTGEILRPLVTLIGDTLVGTVRLLADATMAALDMAEGFWRRHGAAITQMTQKSGRIIRQVLIVAVNTLMGTVQTLGRVANPVIRTLGRLWQQHGPAITRVISSLVNGGLRVLIRVAQTLQNVFGGVVRRMASLATGRIQPIENIVRGVAAEWRAFVGLMNRAGGVIRQSIAAVSSAFNTFRSGVSNAMNRARTVVSSVTSRIGGLLRGFRNPTQQAQNHFQGMQRGAVGAVNRMRTGVQSGFNRVQSAVGETLAPIRQIATRAFNGARQAIVTAVGVIRTAVQTGFTRVRTTVQTTLAPVRQVATRVFDGVRSVVTRAMTAVQNTVGPTITRLANIWSRHTTAIGTESRQTWNVIRSTIATVITRIRAVVTAGVNAVRTAWTRATSAIRTVVTGAFTAVRSTVVSVMTRVRGVILPILTTIRSSFQRAFNTVRTVTQTVFSRVRQVVTQAMTAVRTTVMGALTRVRTIASNVMTAFRTTVTQAMNAAQRVVTQAMTAIRRPVVNALNAIRTAVTSWSRQIQTAFRNAMAAARQAVRTGINAVQNAIRTGLNTARNVTRTALNAIQTAFRTSLNAVRTLVRTVLTTVQTIVRRNMNAVRTIARSVMNATLTVFRSAWNTISRVIETALDGILSGVRVALAALRGDWRGAWNIIAGFTRRTTNRIQSVIRGWRDAIGSIVTALRTTVTTVLRTMWQNARTIVRTGVNGVRTTIRNVFNAVTQFVRNWGGRFVEVIRTSIQNVLTIVRNFGQDLIFGSLVPRIFNAVIQRVTNFGGNFVQTMRDALGKVTTAVRNKLGAVKQTFTDSYNRVKNRTNNLSKNVKRTIRNTLDSLKSAATDWLPNFTQPFTDAKNRVLQEFDRLKDKVVENSIVPEMFAQIRNRQGTWRSGFEGEFQQARTNSSDEFRQLRSAARDIASRMFSHIQDNAGRWRRNFRSEFDSARSGALTEVRNLRGSANDTVSGMLSTLKNQASSWISDFTSPFRDAKDRVLREFNELKDKVVGNSILPDMLDETVRANQAWKSPFLQPFDDARSEAVGRFDRLRDDVEGTVRSLGGSIGVGVAPQLSGAGGSGVASPTVSSSPVTNTGGNALLRPTGQRARRLAATPSVTVRSPGRGGDEYLIENITVRAGSYSEGRDAMRGLKTELRSRNLDNGA